MHIYYEDSTAVLIDGSNTHYALQAIKARLDYLKLKSFFENRSHLKKMFYYTAIIADDQDFNPLAKLIDWLSYNGFCVRSKLAKSFTDAQGRTKIKGNMDIELCVDAMRLIPVVDHFVLFTGDGDFRYLVEALQSLGKKVTAVSTFKSRPSIIADELRRQVDQFVDLGDDFAKEHWYQNQERTTAVIPGHNPGQNEIPGGIVRDATFANPVLSADLGASLFKGKA